MTLSQRDKKILMAIVPLLLIAAYWFLLLSPKREESAQASDELAVQQERVEQAQAQVDAAKRAETDFAADYGEIVRLGKAIPAQVDMPSLLVQLQEAAEGTRIRFTRISTGERTTAPAAPAPPANGQQPSPNGQQPPSGTTPASGGTQPAQSGPGQAAQAANTAAAGANASTQAAEQADPATDTSTSTSTGSGLPVGGGQAQPAGGQAAPAAPAGLETVPLELEFVGDFFRLADFFHDVKRFVEVANGTVRVGGRLITIETVNFSSDATLFPRIKAELTATIYLSPKVEGATAGATPQGPPATTPATTPASTDDSAPGAAPAPTAVATPQP